MCYKKIFILFFLIIFLNYYTKYIKWIPPSMISETDSSIGLIGKAVGLYVIIAITLIILSYTYFPSTEPTYDENIAVIVGWVMLIILVIGGKFLEKK